MNALRLACTAALALSAGGTMPTFAGEMAAPASAATRAPPEATAMPRLATPREGLFVADGQPDADAWRALAGRGIATVVNLRPDGELEGRSEAAEVAAAGLVYRQVPVAGVAGITADNARLLWRAIGDAKGPVLVHCASGNRAGALLALGAAREGGMAPEQALAFGKSAGLTSPKLEAVVRERLGLPTSGE